jgi:class 3 adenylate cyclase
MMETMRAQGVDAPVPATSVMVDLRNFTPNFDAAEVGADGVNEFCRFLGEFYGTSIDACLAALAPDRRASPEAIHAGCTGDGVLVVFLGPWHFAEGLLAGFLLEASLGRLCSAYPAVAGVPSVGFGVGIDSGEVSRVRAGRGGAGFATVIGHCINMSARMEALTKVLSDARVIIGDSTIELCAAALYGETFHALRARERVAADDVARLAIHDRMNTMNRDLCVAYLDRYNLKGVGEPSPLYRPDLTGRDLGTRRFDVLLTALVKGEHAHLDDVRRVLSG